MFDSALVTKDSLLKEELFGLIRPAGLGKKSEYLA
jgi:hypothetical protein